MTAEHSPIDDTPRSKAKSRMRTKQCAYDFGHMYLLNVKTRKLEAFSGRCIPKYGILSHTWSQNEPTFDDFQNRTRRWKLRMGPDYVKINGCCAQAILDRLDYVWIDNCCIDRGSSAELSEAINSMFRWYANAAVCYVYLADVRPAIQLLTSGAESAPVVLPLPIDLRQHEDMKNSRWFTRGWTLQELLAPSMLKFYDLNWHLIGYSSSIDEDGTAGHAKEVPRLTPLLADITRIPKRYLQHEDLNQASVAERMSWASTRQTTRAEDMAYCLLGIFGVNMPMLYGEGEGAFVRLQEEILKTHDDHSIFTWGLEGLLPWRTMGGESMATSPADFRWCGRVTACRPEEERSNHYVTTNVGIHIELPLVQLRSGEYLARLNCTVDSGQPDILLEDKYLSLILTQSRERQNVFYRRTTTSPTLVPLRFFENAPHDSIYLAPSPRITYRQMRNGPLFVSAACEKLFSVRFTYPDVLDVHEGVYALITDLWKHLKNGSGIFLDCVSIAGELFALQVQFVLEEDDTDGGGILLSSASIGISHRRNVRSIVELMLPPEADDFPGMSWETDPVIEGGRIILEPAGANQWKIDVVM
ncbi:Fc.00g033450.m01.CDS01 [Cosmosporella sp. VM-42]